MSIEPTTLSAFGDELTKIAILKTMGNLIRKGWDDSGSWMGKGKFTKYLPIGGKSIMTAGSAAMIPGALSKRDPLGAQRSRGERVSELAGMTIGGLAGTGAMMSLPIRRFPVMRSIIGGIGGSILGSRVATTPWRREREELARPVLDAQTRQSLLPNAQTAALMHGTGGR